MRGDSDPTDQYQYRQRAGPPGCVIPAAGSAASTRRLLKPRRNLLSTRNGRFLAFSVLYISEGIPYGFTSVAMVAFMRQQGVSLESIGIFVGALFLPWAFKWAWAPLIDLIKLHPATHFIGDSGIKRKDLLSFLSCPLPF